MRVGMMVGSDKERSHADRLPGVIADAIAAENRWFTTFWMPGVTISRRESPPCDPALRSARR
jgi:hypothetical protein